MLSDVSWNNELSKLSWRVDVRAMSKSKSEFDEPIAFFEMALNKKTSAASEGTAVQFEMDRGEVDDVLRKLGDVQDAFDRAVK